jgi:alkyl hydroperoxide reductase subunit AhpF
MRQASLNQDRISRLKSWSALIGRLVDHLMCSKPALPGVFAVGDVRAGNVKRVASAVGEGSIAVSFVHQVLAE